MTIKKKIPINYYSRDFNSIKKSLIEHTKRYYPDSYKDFSEASFGSLMLDTVSYIGDILSFYLDYQVNESFLQTSNEFQNVVKLARQMGYKLDDTPTANGIASFFIFVPASSAGTGPDESFIPVLKRGSTFSSDSGAQFILNEDVRFDREDNEIVVGRTDEATGLPTFYAIKSYGRVISGAYKSTSITVGDFKRFLKLKLDIPNISEIISVLDTEGNEYFEVDYLSQDIIYRPIANRTISKKEVSNFLRPYAVPRRFVLEKDGTATYLQFGYGIDSTDYNKDRQVDPAGVVLKYHSKEYISDRGFDPTNLIYSDKFGIVPANTTLFITTRTNDIDDVNISVDNLTNVDSAVFEFDDERNLDSTLVAYVRQSLEVTNEEPINGKTERETTEELKIRALNSLSTQNRAVTREDYKSLVYNMPNEYGSVKRVNVIRDQNSFKRNLNIYVISEDSNGRFSKTNNVLKENIKIWLNNNRMINDTIDILDAKILNIGVDFKIVADLEKNKYEILNEAISSLKKYFSMKKEIGEPIFLSEITKALRDTEGVVDVVSVKLVNKVGGLYPGILYDIYKYISTDGRYINIPDNVVVELRFPNDDIRGAVI